MRKAFEVWCCFPIAGAEWRMVEWTFWEEDAERIAANLEKQGCFAKVVESERGM